MTPGDSELVHAARLGDRDAFGILADRHRARALGLIAAILGDLNEAEDVTQEALFQAYFGIQRLRDPDRFGAWLCGIAINLAKMALRRRRMTFGLEDLDGGRVAAGFRLDTAAPEDAFDARELRRTVRHAIEQLPEDMRAAVWLHYVEGLSYREIGALFGVAPGALRVQTHRARRKLREALAGEWRERPQREETRMIAVDVQDVLIWTPKDWKPDPPERGRALPATLPGGRCVVLLRERDSDRALPMWIGPFEAHALALQLTGHQLVRPLAHDFYARLLDTLGAKIERVTVGELRGNTFIAVVTARASGQAHDVDARPSDAINLAVRAGAPIFVEASILDQAGIQASNAPQALVEAAIQHGETPEADHEWRSGRELVLAQTGSPRPGG